MLAFVRKVEGVAWLKALNLRTSLIEKGILGVC
ncbi:hypothetical protein SAFG77S_10477 [Streptomyces afghaniensis]